MWWARHSEYSDGGRHGIGGQRLTDLVIDFSVPVILVGNKLDLHQERAVSTEEGRKLAESWNRAPFLETSAKQNEVRIESKLKAFGEGI